MPTARPEPVAVLDLVKAAVAVATGFGWVSFDDATAQLVVSGLGGTLFLALTWITRAVVTPKKDPVNDAGEMLVPASTRPTVADAVAAREQPVWTEPGPPAVDYGYGRPPV